MNKIITILFLLIALSASAQDVTRSYNRTPVDDSIRISKALQIPADTGSKKNNLVSILNGTPYFSYGGYWRPFGGISSVGLSMPGVIFNSAVGNSPVTSSGVLTPTLANQSPYTVFGRGSGTGTPTFINGLDSNFVPALHSEAYFNTKYAAFGTTGVSGGTSSQWTTNVNGKDIYFNTGNVGIGIQNPLSILDVRKDTNANAIVNFLNASTGTAAYAKITATNNSNTNIQMGVSGSNAGASTASVAPNEGFLYSTTTLDVIGQNAIRFSTGDPTSNSERARFSSTGNLLVGTTTDNSNGVIQAPSLALNGFKTNNSQLKVASFELQSYAVNNAWIGENTYFNGSFLRRAAGYSGLFYFAGPEGQFRFGANSTAGSSVTQVIPLKVNLDQSVSIGGNQANGAGNYTGSTIVVNSTGITWFTTTAPATPAAGTAVEWWDGTNKRWKKSDGSTGIIY